MPGIDLLSHHIRSSTIGAGGLNHRVRDGIGCDSSAIDTRQTYERFAVNSDNLLNGCLYYRLVPSLNLARIKYGQAIRSISTGKLNASLRLHTRPINLVVFQGSYYHKGREILS